MEQNNKNNIENYDSNSQTEFFNPADIEKPEAFVEIPVEDDYYDEDEYDDNDEDDEDEDEFEGEKDKDSLVNGILITVVAILMILFIVTVVWGVSVLSEINKEKEEEIPPKKEETVVTEEETPEKTDEIEEEEEVTEGEKVECEIVLDGNSVNKSDGFYTVDALITYDGRSFRREVIIDKTTKIEEGGYPFSYISFMTYHIEPLGEREVTLNAVIDDKTYHVDYIYYESEVFEEEPEKEENDEDECFEINDEEGFVIE